MKAPLIWLKDFTDIDVDAKELGDRMTLSGSKVEEIITSGDDISDVYTGKILSVAEHPDSDHLHILRVDLGRDDLGRDIQIVCGAPNVYEGMICPVAIVGAKLPGGKIKDSKIRGVESHGMCCSADELNVTAEGHPGAEEYGLWNMPKDTPLGVDIKEILGLGSVTIDFEITSNRPDCFSIEGLGREAAVTLGHEFKPINPVVKQEGSLNTSDVAKVDILNPELCYRYCARVVEDVKIGPSPAWICERLTQAGMRPINNIVDITNFVCLELGQPMHAFDIDYLSGHHVIVRTAKDGEVIKTLDANNVNNEHVLDSSMLVIADEEKVCAIAGVMGGANSEILDSTKTILFESATFNAVSVRKTALNNGLRTEASSRYEKGLDPENAMRALDRACELIEILGCGKVSKGVIDNYPTRREVKHIPFRPESINKFIGIDASVDFMRDTLISLGCEFVSENGMETIVPPTFRPDLESEADISEEVARFYGYNNIKPTLMQGLSTIIGGRTEEQNFSERIKNTLVSCGYFEAITYSFESQSDLDLLMVPEDSSLRKQVKISNPLGDDTSVMRTTMLPSMLRIAARNFNRGVSKGKVFESAYVYLPDSDSSKLPEERKTLAGFSFDVNASGADLFYGVRDSIFEVASVLGIRSVSVEPCTDIPYFHPGRTASLIVNGRSIGTIGVIHPDVAENFDVTKNACFFEIELQPLLSAAKIQRVYKQLPKFPGATRDLAVIVDKTVAVGDIIKTCKSSGSKLLTNVEFFDVFESEQLGADKKSVAVSLTFRAPDRTLSDDDVNPLMEKILKNLEKRFGAKLR